MAKKHLLWKFYLLMWKNWTLQRRHPWQTVMELLIPLVMTIMIVIVRALVEPEPKDEVHYKPYQPGDMDGTFIKPVAGFLDLRDFLLIHSNVLLELRARRNWDIAWSPPCPELEEIMEIAIKILSLSSDPIVFVGISASPICVLYNDPAEMNEDHLKTCEALRSEETTVSFSISLRLTLQYIITFSTGVIYPDSDTMRKTLDSVLDKGNSTIAAIAFQDDVCKNDKLKTKNLQMTFGFPAELRSHMEINVIGEDWHTNELFPYYQILGPRESNDDNGRVPGYWYQGFLAVQHAIFSALLIHQGGGFNQTDETNNSTPLINQIAKAINSTPDIILQRFPYPAYFQDPLLYTMRVFIPIMFMIGFIYNCFATVKAINTEKELQIKEAMKIMGLPNWLHWTAWFIKTFIFQMISVIMIVIFLKVPWYPDASFSIFTFTNWSVLLVFLMLFVIVTICFDFMISVFFSEATTAALLSGILWILSFVPFMFLNPGYRDLRLSTKIISCLMSNVGLGFGFNIILSFEGTGKGVQWDSLFEPAVQDDNLVLGYIWIMMLIDALIYLLIALYIEAVFPGEFGVPKPWYFLFQRSFWCGSSKYESQMHGGEIMQDLPEDVHEEEPTDLRVGIQIKHLRKVYHEKVVVKDLVLNMYEGQITVLLGHNGAGKTTTLSMLMGMIRPTSGTAILGGYDIRTQMNDIRASLGICPQRNILFNELTVYEHLYFYGKLKGLSGEELGYDIDRYISLLELEPKRFAQAHTLSGGMKRKLSCAVALCGDSRIVMLDEPTSGMDPAARRELWDVLLVEKRGRTMLLTTHFMDEADLLGDRIAIISDGAVQCCGSPFFLKKRYGSGYHLIIVKDPECNVNAVTNLLRRYIPDITEDQNIGSELSYILDEEQANVFEKMLNDLENNKDELHIESYGISLSTMEEVFLRAGKEVEVQEGNHGHNQAAGPKQNSVGEKQVDISPVTRVTGTMLILAQLQAMFRKKLIYEIRTWYLTACQVCIPALLIIVGIQVTRYEGRGQDLPPLEIDLKKYAQTCTPVEVNDTTMRDLANIYIAETSGEEIQGDMSTYMIRKSMINVQQARENCVVGATFKNNTIISWYNNLPYHSAPLALNLAHNTILGKYTNYTLHVVNYPLPYTPESRAAKELQLYGVGYQVALQMGLSMAFVAAFFVLFPVKERICKSKHQQFVSGVNVLIFWSSAYLWDFFKFLLPVLGAIIVLLAFQEDGYKTAEELGQENPGTKRITAARVFLVLVLFVWAVLPYHYLLSFIFNIPSTGYVAVAMLNILTGVVAFTIVTLMRYPILKTIEGARTMDWIFVSVPHYSLSTCLLNLYNNYFYNIVCASVDKNEQVCSFMKNACCRDPADCPDRECLERSDSYFEWKNPGIAKYLSFLFVEGVIFILLLLLIEYRLFHKLYYYKLLPKERCIGKANEEFDDDVAKEREMIMMTPIKTLRKNYALILKEVSKYYGEFLAVNRLSIAIKKGECFGLLGINGAGKTTTFKMMTGDETISCGKGYLHDLNLKTKMKQVHKHIGYCPQFAALLGHMTGRETIVMFCLLRGIPQEKIDNIIKQLAEELAFGKHIDKKVEVYSGGNKRKLSTAVALIGDPSVIFLDEPTSGMDPAARRHLWNVVCKVRDSGKSIILTSHSMDECEALCTRLAIMVNGRLKCLGSVQHLKNKYAKGCTLILKVGKSHKALRSRSQFAVFPSEYYDVDPVKAFVESSFSGAVLKEEYHGLLKYYIEYPTEKWSRMFGILESAKQDLNIEDYSLGQANLEQVFLTFTKHQIHHAV